MKAIFILNSKLSLHPSLSSFKSHYHQTPFPHRPTFLNNLLNSAGDFQNLKHATQIHAQLVTTALFSLPFLSNNLLNLYAKCGHEDQTLLLFSAALDDCKNIVSWTTLITQFSHSRRPFQALTFFNHRRCSGVYPNHYTFSAVLSACTDSMASV